MHYLLSFTRVDAVVVVVLSERAIAADGAECCQANFYLPASKHCGSTTKTLLLSQALYARPNGRGLGNGQCVYDLVALPSFIPNACVTIANR